MIGTVLRRFTPRLTREPWSGSVVKNMFRVILKVLLLPGIATVQLFASAENPGRIELAENWKLASATEAPSEGAAISIASYKDARWHPIQRMPATVLEILQEDGVYSNLYFGKNLLEKVPQDLYKQDWWYRTTFKAPAGDFCTLEFPGINYRAEIWLNGEKIAAYEIGSEDWNSRVQKSKFKNAAKYAKNATGYIDLQDHDGRVESRNIKIRVLPAGPSP